MWLARFTGNTSPDQCVWPDRATRWCLEDSDKWLDNKTWNGGRQILPSLIAPQGARVRVCVCVEVFLVYPHHLLSRWPVLVLSTSILAIQS